MKKKTAKKKKKPVVGDLNAMDEMPKPKSNKISGINVHCLYDKAVAISDLIENPRNPNFHPAQQIKLLAKIIKRHGWRRNITVSNRSGFIVTGHGRLMAAHLLKLKKVPVEFQDYENEAIEWADLVADNKIAELAHIDQAVLDELIEEPAFEDFDLELMGIYDEDFEPGTVDDQGRLDQLDPKMVTCPYCKKEFDLRDVEN